MDPFLYRKTPIPGHAGTESHLATRYQLTGTHVYVWRGERANREVPFRFRAGAPRLLSPTAFEQARGGALGAGGGRVGFSGSLGVVFSEVRDAYGVRVRVRNGLCLLCVLMFLMRARGVGSSGCWLSGCEAKGCLSL